MVLALIQTQMTVEEFDAFVDFPENDDKLFEYVGGEIIEVPSKPYSSMIGGLVFGALFVFLLDKDWGYLTGEAGGYMVNGERYAPDVAYISKAKQPKLAMKGYNPNPPDLAVEVDFPSTVQSQTVLRQKIINYLAAGTVVWAFFPETKRVEICIPGKPVKNLNINDTLDGGEVLPGFKLVLKDIFRETIENNDE